MGYILSLLKENIKSAAISVVMLTADDGLLAAGIISCGQGAGLTNDVPTVQELYDRIIA